MLHGCVCVWNEVETSWCWQLIHWVLTAQHPCTHTSCKQRHTHPCIVLDVLSSDIMTPVTTFIHRLVILVPDLWITAHISDLIRPLRGLCFSHHWLFPLLEKQPSQSELFRWDWAEHGNNIQLPQSQNLNMSISLLFSAHWLWKQLVNLPLWYVVKWVAMIILPFFLSLDCLDGLVRWLWTLNFTENYCK